MDRLISEQKVLEVIDSLKANFTCYDWVTLDEVASHVKALPSTEPKWILTSERLPNVGQWVLVTTKDYQKYVEVMCYQGIRIGQHDVGNGWEEYEYPSWTSGHGDILGSHPEAWMPLPKSWKGKQE